MNKTILATTGKLSKACVRQLGTTEVKHVKPDLTKIKKLQEHFQVNDGVPVHLKNKTSDQILYYTTVAGTIASFCVACKMLYNEMGKK